MKKLIGFVLTLAVGILLGYVLAPTIDGLVKKKVNSEIVDGVRQEANTQLDSAINK